jgi:hypothetical protein
VKNFYESEKKLKFRIEKINDRNNQKKLEMIRYADNLSGNVCEDW